MMRAIAASATGSGIQDRRDLVYGHRMGMSMGMSWGIARI